MLNEVVYETSNPLYLRVSPTLIHDDNIQQSGYLRFTLRDHPTAFADELEKLQYDFSITVTICTPEIMIDDDMLPGKFADIMLLYGSSSSESFADDFDAFYLEPACGYTINYDITYIDGASYRESTSALYPKELEYDQENKELSYEKCVAPELTTTQGQIDDDCTDSTPDLTYQMAVRASVSIPG